MRNNDLAIEYHIIQAFGFEYTLAISPSGVMTVTTHRKYDNWFGYNKQIVQNLHGTLINIFDDYFVELGC